MAIIDEAISSILEGKVKTKGKGRKAPYNAVSNNRATIRLIANKAPEVMTKITGFSKGANNIAPHILYISREGELELESDRGIVFNGKDEVEYAYSKWVDDLNNFPTEGKKPSREVMHLMLSMPEGTNADKVKDAARNFAKKTFSENHEYLFALHTDTSHPHVHLAVKMLGHDQSRLNPRKADLQAWREGFAMELRNVGVRAVASNRRTRGVTKKATHGAVWHIDKGDKSHKKRVAKVTALQMKEAIDDLVSKNTKIPEADKPWNKAIKQRQETVKGLYVTAIKELEKKGRPEDKELAKDLRKISENIPKEIVTQHIENMKKAEELASSKNVRVSTKTKGSSAER